MYPFCTSAERSEAHTCQRGAILLPLEHLSSNCIISTLFYFITKCRAIFNSSVKRSEAHVLKRCIKNCSIVKLYYKIVIINNACMSSCSFTSKAKINSPSLHSKKCQKTFILAAFLKLHFIQILAHCLFPA